MDDDPAHPNYNMQVRLPLDGSAEVLWRDDAVYDIIGCWVGMIVLSVPGSDRPFFYTSPGRISHLRTAVWRWHETICCECCWSG
jgi:hypothetical protein